MDGFKYDSADKWSKVIDPLGQRVNMPYDPGPRVDRLPPHEHLVNPTLDTGPVADEPFVVG